MVQGVMGYPADTDHSINAFVVAAATDMCSQQGEYEVLSDWLCGCCFFSVFFASIRRCFARGRKTCSVGGEWVGRELQPH